MGGRRSIEDKIRQTKAGLVNAAEFGFCCRFSAFAADVFSEKSAADFAADLLRFAADLLPISNIPDFLEIHLCITRFSGPEKQKKHVMAQKISGSLRSHTL